jgi:hypothetical protein
MGGLPRLFASAVALAFLAKAGRRVQPAVFRASGSETMPVALWTKAGLLDQLGALETEIAPSEALAGLVRRLESEKGTVDLVVISHQTTLEDPAFVAALPCGGGIRAYVAAVDRDGQLTFLGRRPHNLTALNTAHIPLESLFAREPARAAAALRNPADRRPAIFRVQPFPLLLAPMETIEIGWRREDGGGVGLTADGSVWVWSDSKQGSRRLPTPALHGRTLGLVYAKEERCWFAAKYRAVERRLELIRWFEGEELEISASFLAFEKMSAVPQDIFARGGFLYVVFSDRVTIIAVRTGELVSEQKFPNHAKPVGTRYLTLTASPKISHYCLFDWDGLALKLTELAIRHTSTLGRIILLFDRESFSAPWAVDEHGRIFDTDEPDVCVLPPVGPVIYAKASPSGSRLWLQGAKQSPKLVSLDDRKVSAAFASPFRHFDGFAEPRRWSVRTKFTHAALTLCSVMLRAQKGYYVEIVLCHGGFRFLKHEDDRHAAQPLPFGPPEEVSPSGCHLRRAEWLDGSAAVLDSRGLLHLQSSDASIPEISFVLAESTALPAWSSDGQMIGPAFFIGDRLASPFDSPAIAEALRRFSAMIRIGASK